MELFLKIHLVLVTKYRKSTIINDFNHFLLKEISNINLKYEFNIVLTNSDKNHVHIFNSF